MNSGKLKIEWAAQYMPVLAAIKKQFVKEKPFAGMTIGMAGHLNPFLAAWLPNLFFAAVGSIMILRTR